jgi:hypothetical protein
MSLKCEQCKTKKAIKKGTLCFSCRDTQYASYVGELKPLKTIKKPCPYCKKDLGVGETVMVRLRRTSTKKMHKACNTKRLKEINTRKWNVNNPLKGGTGSKG